MRKERTPEEKKNTSKKLFCAVSCVAIAAITFFVCKRGYADDYNYNPLPSVLVAGILIAIIILVNKFGVKRILTKQFSIIACMAIAVLMSFLPYTLQNTSTAFFGKIKTSMQAVSIAPNMLSCLYGIILYSAILIRFRRPLFKNAIETITAILDILFFASFLTIFVSAETFRIPLTNFSGSGHTILIIGILFSWLGIKAVAGIVWILLLILGLHHISIVNNAMGFYGIVYILCAFVSLVYQIGDIDMLKTVADDLRIPAEHIKEETLAGGKAVGDGAKAVVNTATKVAGMAAGIPPQVTTAITEKSGD